VTGAAKLTPNEKKNSGVVKKRNRNYRSAKDALLHNRLLLALDRVAFNG
jgi:hypothetical protein